MNCPECSARTEVVKTTVAVYGKVLATQRLRECRCGVRLLTEERLVKRLPVVAGGCLRLPVVARGGPQPTANPLAMAGGEGGGVSSGSDLSLTLPSQSNPDQTRARRKRRADYTPDFLRVWAVYPRKVAKGAAFEMWLTMQPEPDAVIATLSWQRNSADWTREGGKFIPHLKTYLHESRWEDEPAKPTQVVARPDRLVASTDDYIRRQREAQRRAEADPIPLGEILGALRGSR